MSVKSEIDRLTTAKAELKTAITARGGVIDENDSISVYAAALNDAALSISDVDGLQEALDAKAEKGKSVSITLTAAGWSGGKQSVAAAGVTAASNGVFAPAQSVTADQIAAWAAGLLMITAQTADSVTVTAFGEVPAVDLPGTIWIGG